MNNILGNNNQLRELLKMAIITSPLIGIYTISPVLLFIFSMPKTEALLLFWDNTKLLISALAITIFVFVQWLINIWLFKFIETRRKNILGKNWKYIVSYGVFFTLVTIGHIIRADKAPIDLGSFKYYPYIGSFANNTFILIIYHLVTNRVEKAQLELDKTKLELSNYVTQQEQLKNKIHPHFLFNALNTLKLLIKKEQKSAENYLVRLSAFLRFSITETTKDTALIKDELEFCQNYIELQKVRFSNSIEFYNLLKEEIINSRFLPVVTFQMLAENAIKHNAFTKANPLIIKINQIDNETISFSNNIIPKRTNEKSTGTGLQNLNERFKLLGRDELKVEEDKDKELFTVTFKTIEK